MPMKSKRSNPANCGKIMSDRRQLDLWVEGKPIHNGITRGHGECTPDFSCCHAKLLWPEKDRIAFRDADRDSRAQMLGRGLSALLNKQGYEVVK